MNMNMHIQTIMMLIGIIGALPPAFALFEFEFKCKAKVARAYDEAFGTPACGRSVPARNPFGIWAQPFYHPACTCLQAFPSSSASALSASR